MRRIHTSFPKTDTDELKLLGAQRAYLTGLIRVVLWSRLACVKLCAWLSVCWLSNLALTVFTSDASAMATWTDIRDRDVVKQSLDYSCGAAALATLVSDQLGQNLDEAKILEAWIEQNTIDATQPGPKVKVGDKIFDAGRGMSFEGIARLGDRFGYQAYGISVPLAILPKIKQPVLLYLEDFGQAHFTVLKSASAKGLLLADPSWGNTLIRYEDLPDLIPHDHARIMWLRASQREDDLESRSSVETTPRPSDL